MPALAATRELGGRRGDSSQARQGAGAMKFVVPILYVPAALQFLPVPVVGRPTSPPRRKEKQPSAFQLRKPKRTQFRPYHFIRLALERWRQGQGNTGGGEEAPAAASGPARTAAGAASPSSRQVVCERKPQGDRIAKADQGQGLPLSGLGARKTGQQRREETGGPPAGPVGEGSLHGRSQFNAEKSE